MAGRPAAKQGDQVIAIDIHMVHDGPAILAIPHPFAGKLSRALSPNVKIEGRPAAVLGSVATLTPPHMPIGGNPFAVQPRHQGRVVQASQSVLVNGKPLARAGDTALTCNDPVDAPVGRVVAAGRVLVGR
jgi:uncharacterized Zn-binding protein involved in type VI secretion